MILKNHITAWLFGQLGFSDPIKVLQPLGFLFCSTILKRTVDCKEKGDNLKSHFL